MADLCACTWKNSNGGNGNPLYSVISKECTHNVCIKNIPYLSYHHDLKTQYFVQPKYMPIQILCKKLTMISLQIVR